MKRLKASLTLAISAFVLGGCATTYEHATADQAQFDRDKYQCQQEAASMYPPVYGQRPPPPQSTSSTTNCRAEGSSIQCYTRQNPPRQTIGGALAEYAASQDQNEGRRKAAVENCISSKGYVRK